MSAQVEIYLIFQILCHLQTIKYHYIFNIIKQHSNFKNVFKRSEQDKPSQSLFEHIH